MIKKPHFRRILKKIFFYPAFIISFAYTTAIPLAVAGLFLTMIVRTISVGLVHGADAAAKEGNIGAVERTHLVALLLQGLRIAIPAALLLAVPTSVVQGVLNAMPAWLSGGMAVGGEIGRASCRERV